MVWRWRKLDNFYVHLFLPRLTSAALCHCVCVVCMCESVEISSFGHGIIRHPLWPRPPQVTQCGVCHKGNPAKGNWACNQHRGHTTTTEFLRILNKRQRLLFLSHWFNSSPRSSSIVALCTCRNQEKCHRFSSDFFLFSLLFRRNLITGYITHVYFMSK